MHKFYFMCAAIGWVACMCLSMAGVPVTRSSQPRRLLGYVRASTSRQIASPEVQKHTIRSYVHYRGWNPDDIIWYVDQAKSGKLHINDRKAGRALMQGAKEGDAIIVARMDRLVRSIGAFGRFVEVVDRLGVSLHMCDVPGGALDPANPTSRLFISILVCFAEYERTLIIGRTCEGKAKSRREGKFQGTSHMPYGYLTRRTNERRGAFKHTDYLIPNHAERAMGERAIALKEEGYTLSGIVHVLNKEGFRRRNGRIYDRYTAHMLVHRAYKLRLKLKEEAEDAERDTGDYTEVPSAMDI